MCSTLSRKCRWRCKMTTLFVWVAVLSSRSVSSSSLGSRESPAHRHEADKDETIAEQGDHVFSAGEDAQVNFEDRVEIVLMTNRIASTSAVLASVCRNSLRSLAFSIVLPDDRLDEAREHLKPASCSSAEVRYIAESAMVQGVLDAGLSAAWEIQVPETQWSVKLPQWDRNNFDTHGNKHNSAFNALRFYLAKSREFEHLDAIVFLDDDVILQGDIGDLWDMEQEQAISGGCLNWVWQNQCNRMQASTFLSYAEVPYFDFGAAAPGAAVTASNSDFMCHAGQEEECAPPGFFDTIEHFALSLENGPSIDIHSRLQARAFNFGINKFVLSRWRERSLTERYMTWIEANAKFGWFPSSSLGFGLGIPMLAFMDEVVCLDDNNINILHGLGFVEPDELEASGILLNTLPSFYALHWNGDRKPWLYDKAIPEYADYFLDNDFNLKLAYELGRATIVHDDYNDMDASSSMFTGEKQEYLSSLEQGPSDLPVVPSSKTRGLASKSFVVWTAPRSGSEWFMSILDEHPNVCASGEASSSSRGWPREALLPLKQANWNTCEPKAICHWTVVENMLEHLLDSEHYIVEGGERSKRPVACIELELSAQKQKQSSSIYSVPVTSGIFGPHLRTICLLAEHAMEKVANSFEYTNDRDWRDQVMTAAFSIYSAQLVSGRSLYTSVDDHQVSSGPQPLRMPCGCPLNTTAAGTKVMSGWILPRTNNRNRKLMVQNSDLQVTSREIGFEKAYNFSSSVLRATNSKIIILDRANLLAAYVSLRVSQVTRSFHCTGRECTHEGVISINVNRLKTYIETNVQQRLERDAFLASTGLDILRVEYENCVEHSMNCFGRVLDFLGVDNSTESENDYLLEQILEKSALDGLSRDARAVYEKVTNFPAVASALIAAGHDQYITDDDFVWLRANGHSDILLSTVNKPISGAFPKANTAQHILLLSDRATAVAATLTSVCVHLAPLHYNKTIIHLVLPEDPNNPAWSDDFAPACIGIAQISKRSIASVESEVTALLGELPVWRFDDEDDTVQRVYSHYARDRSPKHISPFNLARFYVPLLSEYDNVDTLILLDDDVLIQSDVGLAFEQARQIPQALVAGCHNWVLSDSFAINITDTITSSLVANVFETANFGFRPVAPGRPYTDATCLDDADLDCMPDDFLTLLANSRSEVQSLLHGKEKKNSLDAENGENLAALLAKRPAWNFGVAAVDIPQWRGDTGISRVYHTWAKASHKHELFPRGSLAHGLGLAYLALDDRVQCWETSINENALSVIQGLGYIPPEVLTNQDILTSTAFALHFNGEIKPWHKFSPYRELWLEYNVVDSDLFVDLEDNELIDTFDTERFLQSITDDPYFIPPTSMPTKSPTTAVPSPSPTELPTTASPSAIPTSLPTTSSPSLIPTLLPSSEPTLSPSEAPSSYPTPLPTTGVPSVQPSLSPTTAIPSTVPTSVPTLVPTAEPTTPQPSPLPSFIPTTSPPSAEPTSVPTLIPTMIVTTAVPSSEPTEFFASNDTETTDSSGPNFGDLLGSIGSNDDELSATPTAVPTSSPTITVFDFSGFFGPRAPEPTTPMTPFNSSIPSLEPTSYPTTLHPSFIPTPSPVNATAEPSTQPTVIPIVDLDSSEVDDTNGTVPAPTQGVPTPTASDDSASDVIDDRNSTVPAPSQFVPVPSTPELDAADDNGTAPIPVPTLVSVDDEEGSGQDNLENVTSLPISAPTAAGIIEDEEVQIPIDVNGTSTSTTSVRPSPVPTLRPLSSSNGGEAPATPRANYTGSLDGEQDGENIIVTLAPVHSPTAAPSTWMPSLRPSILLLPGETRPPTVKPTTRPTPIPTPRPTPIPTPRPTPTPTPRPTAIPGTPTRQPSQKPTPKPTLAPTPRPSDEPTLLPTAAPTFPLTPVPTPETPFPTISANPTQCPSFQPTSMAPTTSIPSSIRPTSDPSSMPQSPPSSEPTLSLPPSSEPTTETAKPTPETPFPSSGPTTSAPTTASPTTVGPTLMPTTPEPSAVPSAVPTPSPTDTDGSRRPSSCPTSYPSVAPSPVPTAVPSSVPSAQPTFTPSISPTDAPSLFPTLTSEYPTSQPSTTAPTITWEVCAGVGEFDLSFTSTSVTSNNLGGLGPSSLDPEELRYAEIARSDYDPEVAIDLVITVASGIGGTYAVDTTADNGQNGPFGQINVLDGTQASLHFEFVHTGTNTSINMSRFILSFVDIDQNVNPEQETEYICIDDSDFDLYVTSEDPQLDIYLQESSCLGDESGSSLVAAAMSPGFACDDPTSADQYDEISCDDCTSCAADPEMYAEYFPIRQQERVLMLGWGSKPRSGFDIHLGVKCQNSPCDSGRNFMFAGRTQMCIWPTASPSVIPTPKPSQEPTLLPSSRPTILPTTMPSQVPTAKPTPERVFTTVVVERQYAVLGEPRRRLEEGSAYCEDFEALDMDLYYAEAVKNIFEDELSSSDDEAVLRSEVKCVAATPENIAEYDIVADGAALAYIVLDIEIQSDSLIDRSSGEDVDTAQLKVQEVFDSQVPDITDLDISDEVAAVEASEENIQAIEESQDSTTSYPVLYSRIVRTMSPTLSPTQGWINFDVALTLFADDSLLDELAAENSTSVLWESSIGKKANTQFCHSFAALNLTKYYEELISDYLVDARAVDDPNLVTITVACENVTDILRDGISFEDDTLAVLIITYDGPIKRGRNFDRFENDDDGAGSFQDRIENVLDNQLAELSADISEKFVVFEESTEEGQDVIKPIVDERQDVFFLHPPPTQAPTLSFQPTTVIPPTQSPTECYARDRPRPPYLASALFSDSGAAITAVLDSPSDRYSQGGSAFDCDLIFVVVGDTVRCTFLADDTVNVELDYRSSMAPFDKMTLIGGKLLAKGIPRCPEDEFATGNATSVNILPPLNPVIPSIQIAAPAAIGLCTALVVDASGTTGSGGRPFRTVKWSLRSVPSSDVINATRLARQNRLLRSVENEYEGQALLTIEDAIVFELAGDYIRVTVEFVNFLHGADRQTLPLVFVDPEPIPDVYIEGGEPKTALIPEFVRINAVASAIKCSFDKRTENLLNYTWSVFAINAAGTRTRLSTASKLPQLFDIQAYDIPFGTRSLSALVNVRDFRDLSNAALQETLIVKSPIVAIFASGQGTTTTSQEPFTLDATLSYDPDAGTFLDQSLAGTTGFGFRYQWSCLNVTSSEPVEEDTSNRKLGSCGDLVHAVLEQSTRGRVTLREPPIKGIYAFTVIVTSIDESFIGGTNFSASQRVRTASATTRITFVNEPVPRITINALTQSAINPQDALTIEATVGPNPELPYEVKWELIDGFFTDGTQTFDEFALIDTDLVIERSEGVTPAYLVLASGALTPGAFYSFQLTAVFAVDDEERRRYDSVASISLTVNRAPTSGLVSLDPEIGYTLETLFKMSCLFWTDDIDDFPLVYSFFSFFEVENEVEVEGEDAETATNTELIEYRLLSDSFASSHQAYLAEGSVSRNYTRFVEAEISDRFGATTRSSSNLAEVRPLEDVTISRLSNITVGLLKSAQEVDNVEEVMQVLVASTAIQIGNVNCSLAPFDKCQALNRGQCLAVNQTCGPCLSGYIDLMGTSSVDGDIPCVEPEATCTDEVLSGNETDIDCGSFECLPCLLNQTCTRSSDCSSGYCSDMTSRCAIDPAAPTCGEETCNGNGVCVLRDFEGAIVGENECEEVGVDGRSSCTTTCECFLNATTGQPAWYGSVCALTEQEYIDSLALRTEMISALSYVHDRQARAPSALNQQSSTLAAVARDTASLTCESTDTVLTLTNSLAGESSQRGLENGTADALVTTLSFLLGNGALGRASRNVTGNATILANLTNTTVFYAGDETDSECGQARSGNFSQSINSLAGALRLNAVPGQKPLELVSSNINVATQRLSGAQTFAGTTLGGPRANPDDAVPEVIFPSFDTSRNGTASIAVDEPMDATVIEFFSSVHPDADPVDSTILRFSVNNTNPDSANTLLSSDSTEDPGFIFVVQHRTTIPVGLSATNNSAVVVICGQIDPPAVESDDLNEANVQYCAGANNTEVHNQACQNPRLDDGTVVEVICSNVLDRFGQCLRIVSGTDDWNGGDCEVIDDTSPTNTTCRCPTRSVVGVEADYASTSGVDAYLNYYKEAFAGAVSADLFARNGPLLQLVGGMTAFWILCGLLGFYFDRKKKNDFESERIKLLQAASVKRSSRSLLNEEDTIGSLGTNNTIQSNNSVALIAPVEEEISQKRISAAAMSKLRLLHSITDLVQQKTSGSDEMSEEHTRHHKKHHHAFMAAALPPVVALSRKSKVREVAQEVAYKKDRKHFKKARLLLDMIRKNNSFTSIVFVYHEHDPRMLRCFICWIECMLILFGEAVAFWWAYPSGLCENMEEETNCLRPKSAVSYGQRSTCAWVEEDNECIFQPASTALEVASLRVQMAAICVLAALPAVHVIGILHERYLLAPVKENRSKNEVESESKEEIEKQKARRRRRMQKDEEVEDMNEAKANSSRSFTATSVDTDELMEELTTKEPHARIGVISKGDDEESSSEKRPSFGRMASIVARMKKQKSQGQASAVDSGTDQNILDGVATVDTEITGNTDQNSTARIASSFIAKLRAAKSARSLRNSEDGDGSISARSGNNGDGGDDDLDDEEEDDDDYDHDEATGRTLLRNFRINPETIMDEFEFIEDPKERFAAAALLPTMNVALFQRLEILDAIADFEEAHPSHHGLDSLTHVVTDTLHITHAEDEKIVHERKALKALLEYHERMWDLRPPHHSTYPEMSFMQGCLTAAWEVRFARKTFHNIWEALRVASIFNETLHTHDEDDNGLQMTRSLYRLKVNEALNPGPERKLYEEEISRIDEEEETIDDIEPVTRMEKNLAIGGLILTVAIILWFLLTFGLTMGVQQMRYWVQCSLLSIVFIVCFFENMRIIILAHIFPGLLASKLSHLGDPLRAPHAHFRHGLAIGPFDLIEPRLVRGILASPHVPERMKHAVRRRKHMRRRVSKEIERGFIHLAMQSADVVRELTGRARSRRGVGRLFSINTNFTSGTTMRTKPGDKNELDTPAAPMSSARLLSRIFSLPSKATNKNDTEYENDDDTSQASQDTVTSATNDNPNIDCTLSSGKNVNGQTGAPPVAECGATLVQTQRDGEELIEGSDGSEADVKETKSLKNRIISALGHAAVEINPDEAEPGHSELNRLFREHHPRSWGADHIMATVGHSGWKAPWGLYFKLLLAALILDVPGDLQDLLLEESTNIIMMGLSLIISITFGSIDNLLGSSQSNALFAVIFILTFLILGYFCFLFIWPFCKRGLMKCLRTVGCLSMDSYHDDEPDELPAHHAEMEKHIKHDDDSDSDSDSSSDSDDDNQNDTSLNTLGAPTIGGATAAQSDASNFLRAVLDAKSASDNGGIHLAPLSEEEKVFDSTQGVQGCTIEFNDNEEHNNSRLVANDNQISMISIDMEESLTSSSRKLSEDDTDVQLITSGQDSSREEAKSELLIEKDKIDSFDF